MVRVEVMFVAAVCLAPMMTVLAQPLASSQVSEHDEKSESQGRISIQKCREYSKSVFIQTNDPNGDGMKKIDTCSLSEPLRRKRLVNGINANPREFPHMAEIGVGEKSNAKWLCGGTLISERFVLSGATCGSGGKTGIAKWVKLGDYDRASTIDDDESNAKSKVYEIEEIIAHPEYKQPQVYNDIALFKLKEDVTFNEYVRPICLHTEPTIDQVYGIATGWGLTEWGGDTSDVLQKANLTIIGWKQCVEKYAEISSYRLANGLNDTIQLCAGDDDKNTCKGDAGGPLQVRLVDPYCMYSQVGIVSFGVKCASSFPGVFTRVSHYVPWIESIVWPQL